MRGPRQPPNVSSRPQASPPLRSGSSSDTPATSVVLRLRPNAGVRPLNGPEPHHIFESLPAGAADEHARRDQLRTRTPLQARRIERTRIGRRNEVWHHQQCRGTAGSGCSRTGQRGQESCH